MLCGAQSSPHPNGAALEDDARADVHLRGLARWIGCLRGKPRCVLLVASPKADRKPGMVHNLDIAVSLCLECTDSDVLAREDTPADSNEESDKDENNVEHDRPIVTAVPAHCFSLLKELFSATGLRQRLLVFRVSNNNRNIAVITVRSRQTKNQHPCCFRS